MRNTKGFTLIELLIVVVIIGILAAIALPQFASTKEKSYDAAAKSDLRNLMTAMEAYFSDNQTYPATVTISAGGTWDADGAGGPEAQASQQVSLAATGDADGYQATASHAAANATWCVNTNPDATNPGRITKAGSC